jgi:hypothetical protein
MVYTIATVTTNAGVPKALASTRTPANWCQITALAGNTGANVWIGGVNPANKGATLVLASATVGVGLQLAKGATLLLPSISAVSYLDLSTIFFDVLTNGDGVSVTYGIR